MADPDTCPDRWDNDDGTGLADLEPEIFGVDFGFDATDGGGDEVLDG